MAKQYKCPGCNNVTKFADHPCPNCKHVGNCSPGAGAKGYTFGCRNCDYCFANLNCRICDTLVSDGFIEEEPIEVTEESLKESLKIGYYVVGIALLIYYVFF